MKEIRFKSIHLDITSRCNMKCRHCRNFTFKPKDELTLGDVKKIIKFLSAFGNERSNIIISGGEPFLHPDIFNILNFLDKSKFKIVTITTNGSLINRKIIDKLNSFEFVTRLVISLDDSRRSFHDYFRRFDGAFDKAAKSVKMIEKFKSQKIRVFIRTTIVPENIKRIGQMIDFFKKLGARGVTFTGVFPAAKRYQNKRIIMSPASKKYFLEKIKEAIDTESDKFVIRMFDPLITLIDPKLNCFSGCNPCQAGIKSFAVLANGSLVPCPPMSLPIFNVKELSVDEMVKKYQNSPIIDKLQNKEFTGKCAGCSLKNNCGGCRARAWSKGDYLGEDPDCWI